VSAVVTEEQKAAITRALRRPAPEREFVLVQHLPGGGQPRNVSGPTVARTMFETDSLPRSWRQRLQMFDEVWVPTEWNASTFARAGVPADALSVLPETLDFSLFAPGSKPLELDAPRAFVFLTNFDFTDRKGWDVLLDAWVGAFDPDEDVCLVLKCLGLHIPEREVRARIDWHLGERPAAPIVVRTEVLPVREMPRLYAAADAFVIASRGEGWGRPYMEAMAMGVPTIGTRFSGNLAFMTDANSFLVDGDLVPVPDSAQAHTDVYRGHRWLEPDRAALAATLRSVFDDPHAARARAARARDDLLERFGPAIVARRIAELTESALARWRDRQCRPVACVWRGDFGSGHSLAVVNDAVTAGLERQGSRVVRVEASRAAAAMPAVGVAQQWPPRFDAPAHGPFVLFQPWEFGAIPERWAREIRRSVDEVWVPSEATREAFLASRLGADLVHVIPNGVDLERFTPHGDTFALAEAGTVFLFVGGTIHRKGIDVLLAAYGSAFTSSDDVCLVVKSFGGQTVYRGMGAEQELARFSQTPRTPRLVVCEDDISYADIPALYRGADVLVQPYRAEGFCLPALEALACGLPVIVTAGGPTDEFVTDDCAWRIPSRRVPMPPGSLPSDLVLDGEGFLLEPDVASLVAALRECTDPAARAHKASRAREQAERFGWDRAAATAQARLAVLAGRTPVRRLSPADVPGRRGTLFAVVPAWEQADTWAPAVIAYARAFSAADDTTLVLPVGDCAIAGDLVERELVSAGIDLSMLADVVLAEGAIEPAALELAADAIVTPNGYRPLRARRVIPPDADALRAVAAER